MQAFDESLKFKKWKGALLKNGVRLDSIREIESVRKKNGEVLFSLLEMKAQGDDGVKLLPIVLLRGNFVSIVTILKEKESGEEWMLLVKQRRVANGAYFYEHPAGMMDSSDDPFEIAMIEMEEETGVKITRDQLKLLCDQPVYSSPGLLDESGWYFVCELEMSKVEIDLLRDGQQGDAHEGEFISNAVVKPSDAWKLIRNANGLLNLCLYEKYKAGIDLGQLLG